MDECARENRNRHLPLNRCQELTGVIGLQAWGAVSSGSQFSAPMMCDFGFLHLCLQCNASSFFFLSPTIYSPGLITSHPLRWAAQKEKEGKVPNSFCKAVITMMPKHNEGCTETGNCSPVPLMNIKQIS